MNVQVSVIKGGNVVASKVVTVSKPGDLESAISEVIDQARQTVQAPLWPFTVDVR